MIRLLCALMALLAAGPPCGAAASGHPARVVLGMALEPPGLDPTSGAAASIGEITHYNIFEGLTKINADNSVTPLLAEAWSLSPDGLVYRFTLRDGVFFHDGVKLTSADVRFSFERAGAPDSINKTKRFFQDIARLETPDPLTIVVAFKQPDPDALFKFGLSSAVIVSPKTAATNAINPVGTGPFAFKEWVKGASVTLDRAKTYRDPASIALDQVVFRFINDPAAQVAALLAGDVDAFPRFGSLQNVAQFQADPRFAVSIGGTEGKTILAINNKRPPLDDRRIRQAIAHAIDRNALIEGAMNGFGRPIGSHMVPNDPGYVDLVATYPYDLDKARALLRDAGVSLPLRLSLQLPPPAYARLGGEIIAAQLAKIGIEAKIENVEWAQWLSGVYANHNYDLTVISHVEPMDIGIYADPTYYFNYDSPSFRAQMEKLWHGRDPDERRQALGEAQRMLAQDAVNAFLFQLPQITIADRHLKGLWADSPIFANDMASVRWD
jgi:peptide/nickel transport system substrate-binding protein